jgi:PAS domain S-box-containing protein
MPTFHFTRNSFLAAIFCAFVILTAAGWFFTGSLVEMATRTVKEDVHDANLIISLNLINELKKIQNAAVAVSGSPLTLPILQVNVPENLEKANNILDRYHKSLDAAACYLINQEGLTLASSNRNAKDSFVGQNYTFRPYFQQAMKGDVSQHFAFGTVSKKRGIFASAPVKDKEGNIVGVVVIKKEVEDIEASLKQYIWFLVDQNGIIFMSSQPDVRLKSLWPLDHQQQQKIILSKQYGPGPFQPVMQRQFKRGENVSFKGGKYLSEQIATPYEGVSVVLLWPTEQISNYLLFGILLTLLTILLTLSFLTAVYIFTQSNLRMKKLLKESQSQAEALAVSERQLTARRDELEEQKELLAQSEERSRLILGSMSEGIFGMSNDGRVTFINPAVSTILGYTEKELLGKLMHTEVHHTNPDGSEFPRLQCPMYLTSQDGKARNVDNEVFWRKDGTAVPVEYSTTPVWNDGQVVATVVSFHDITERKRADALKVGKEVAEEAAARAEQARQDAERSEAELQTKLLEIERFNRLALGREERIIDLKRQVNDLALKAGEKPFYREHELTGSVDEELVMADATAPESEPSEIDRHSLAEMLNVEQFQRLLTDFCESVGIASAIIDLKGEVLVQARWQRACTDFHRVNEKTCARCIESDTELALNLNAGKPFSVYRCKNGLTDAASPIIVEGKHIANTFVGQFLTSPPDMDYFRRQAEECGLDADQYLAAIRDVPVVAENKLQSVLGFLVGVAQAVAAMSMERIRARQAEIFVARQIEEIKRERASAMSLAEDADQARLEIEQYKGRLELLVQERTDELRMSEERSNLILGSMQEGIWGLDTKSNTTFVNRAALDMLGYTEEEVIGKSMHELVHYAYSDGSAYPPEKCHMYKTFVDGTICTIDNEVLWRKDGSSFPVEYTTTPIRKEGGLVGTVVAFHDITERRAMEQQIIDEGERMKKILDTAPVSIAFSTKSRIHFANPLFAETFGVKAGDASPQLYVNPEDRDLLVERLKKGEIVKDFEIKMFNSQRQVRDMLITYMPINYEGEDGILGWMTDITERKEAEENVNAFFNSSSDGLLILSPERGFIHANQTATAMFGFKSAADLIKCGPVELSPPYQPDGRPSQDAAVEHINKALRMDTPLHFDWIHKRTDGTEFPCEIVLVKILLAHKQQLLTSIRDITARKKAEEATLEAKNRTDAILGASTNGIVTINEKGIIETFNPAAERIFGYTLDEISGRNVSLLMPDEHADRHDTYLNNYLQTGIKKVIGKRLEVTAKRKNGELFPVEIGISEVFLKDAKLFTAIINDITERRRAEKELKERMEELERFNQITINRELKMIELKEKINNLLKQMGKEEIYKIVE